MSEKLTEAITRTVRGCGELPGYGGHPGSAFLGFLVVVGAFAGAQRGSWLGAALGAGAMIAVFGPMYLRGAYERARDYDAGLAALQEHKE